MQLLHLLQKACTYPGRLTQRPKADIHHGAVSFEFTTLHADSKDCAGFLVYLSVHIYSFVRGALVSLNVPCCRLAYSNALFFVVHEVHDLVGAIVEGLLSAVSGLPADQQHTCSR